MGMFDTVRAVNIADKAFKHNGVCFQTKSLGCDMSDYILFNQCLWKQSDGESCEVYEKARKTDLSGIINIYTDHHSLDQIVWVEYNITLKDGEIVDVELIEERVTKDLRDKSNFRPLPKSGNSVVNIDFRGLENDRVKAFYDNLSGSLDAVRNAIGDPRAEIVYREKRDSRIDNPLHAFLYSEDRWVHSVVQSLDDFKSIGDNALERTDNHGDSLRVFVDEFSEVAGGD